MLQMLADYPLLFPNKMDLLLNPHRQCHPLIQNGHLTLGTWLVSGIPEDSLLIYNASWRDQQQNSTMIKPGISGLAGANQRLVNPILAPLKEFLTDFTRIVDDVITHNR